MEWKGKPHAGMQFDTTELADDIAAHARSIRFDASTSDVKWDDGGPHGAPVFWQEFGQKGAIFHSGYPSKTAPKKRIIEVPAAIFAKYIDQGGSKKLGMPRDGKKDIPNRRGAFFYDFENGSIYFSDKTGAHFIGGAVRDKWREVGGHGGKFGLPITDESIDTAGGGLRYTDFENGSIWATEESIRAIQGVRIEYTGFHCFGESPILDIDEGASDEVYFVVEAEPFAHPARPDERNDSTWVTILPKDMKAYEFVNRGDTIHDLVTLFWGRPAPLRLKITGFDQDSGDPNLLRAKIQGAVAAGGVAASFAFPVASWIFLNPQVQAEVTNTITAILDSGDSVIQSDVWAIRSRRALLDTINRGEQKPEFALAP